MLGSPLEEVKKSSDFFGWFGLQQTGEQPAAGGVRRFTFQPNGPAFHEVVTVHANVDAQGVITAMELLLDRSFIEHPTNGIFAADIAKSFLRNATLPEAGAAALQALADEIEFQARTDRPMLARPRPTPPLPDEPSPGYRTYRGRQERCELPLSQGLLRLENRVVTGSDWLAISIEFNPQDPPRLGFWRRLLYKLKPGARSGSQRL